MSDQNMQVEMSINIKAYDIDAMGIVSNIVYIRWFEDLRHLFLDKYYPYDVMMGDGISPILMKTEVSYKSPLIISDHPTAICKIVNLGNSKWEMEFVVKSKDTIHCTGKQLGCFYNLKTRKTSPVPSILREAYNELKQASQN